MDEHALPSRFFFDRNYLASVGVERPRDILFVVLHHSGGIASSDLPWLTTQGQVSAHRYVSRDGTRYRLLEDEQAAWGCAVAPRFEVSPPPMGKRWARNENWPSLQIEMENRGGDPFTDAQYRAVADWVAAWVQAYGIPADRTHLLGHRELTTSPQHQDPNSHWEWPRFMAEVQRRLLAADYKDYPIQGAATISRARFAAILAAPPSSPVAGEADRYYDCCVEYGVNPAVALAVFVKESDRGTVGLAPETANWGNQRQAWRAARTQGTRPSPWGTFPVYRSWLDSLADWCEILLSEVYRGEGRTTLRSVLPKYAPAFENNTDQYIQQTISWITAWQHDEDPRQEVLPGSGDHRPLAT